MNRTWNVKLGFAIALVAVAVGQDARADFDKGTRVVTIAPDEMHQSIYRVQKGDDVMLAVGNGGNDLNLICAVFDQDGDGVATDKGANCMMSFKAGYSGKYKLRVKNKGAKDAAVTITGSW